MNKRIGLVGTGNMGTSILEGVLRERIAIPGKIWVYDKIAGKARLFARRTGVQQAASAGELFRRSEVVLLAMKPQDFPAFATENRDFLGKRHCLVSILAGVSTAGILRAFKKKISVIRAMPNLGAKVGESMTVVCGRDPQSLSCAEKLFSGCGKVLRLSEQQLDLVTAISGSGPAYFFYLMELLEDFGVKHGLPRAVAAALAVQTGVGAALLARGTAVPCGVLRRQVTSKKGTTEAALKVLERKKFGGIFQQGLSAAMMRSRALRGKKAG